MSRDTIKRKGVAPELLELALKKGASTRIENCLRHAYGSGLLKIRTVREYLAHGKQGPPSVFFAIPNLGAKSRRELHEMVLSAVSHPLTVDPANPRAAPLDGVELQQIPRTADPPEFSAVLSSCLTSRELSVVRRRFGFAGYSSATLEDIGSHFDVTRERIRQIEKKAVDKLARQKKDDLQTYLNRNVEGIISHLWRGIPWVSSSELDARVRTLDGETRLALSAAYSSWSEWLSKVAQSTHRGWLLRQASSSEFRGLVKQVVTYLNTASLPINIKILASSLRVAPELAAAAVRAVGGHRVYRGYVCSLIVGARTRRALALVETLLRVGRGRALSIEQLAEACRERNTRIAPTTRDVNIVLASHKHLFVNLFEEGWATCAPGLESNYLADTTAEHSGAESESAEAAETDLQRWPDDPSEHTLRSFLRQLLGTKGPMQMADIRDALDSAKAGEFSRASVGPTLLLSEDFIRIAPGVYALHEAWQSGDISADQVERVLLTESQCTMYVQARWAGEPQTLYPAWTEPMELAWARWARRENRAQLLDSLLTIANTQSWPVGSTERRAWMEIERRGGQYGLAEKLRVPLEETVPSFLDVLSASLWARQQGHLSWISANRVTGRRVDDRHSASIIALLVLFGVLDPAEHWQGSHVYCVDANSMIDTMLDFAFRTENGWPTELAIVVTGGARRASDFGWLRDHDIAPLLAEIASGTTLVSSLDQVSLTSSDGVEDIFTELRKRTQRSKLAEMIDE